MTSHSSGVPGEAARSARVAELRELGLAGIAELIEQLITPSWAVRRAVVAALAEARATATPLLCQALRKQRDNEARIAGLVDALSASKNHVDGAVLELLTDDDDAIVCDAVQILGRRESRNAVPALTQLLSHENDNVALAAVEALGRIGGRAALDSLLILTESGNFFRTFPTIDVLGRAGDSRVLPALLRLVADPLYGAEAARALGRVGDPSAIPTLLDHLNRAGDSVVRAIAAALLAIHAHSEQRFGTGLAVESLLLTSPRLAQLREQLTNSLKRADASEQLAVSQVLGWVGEENSVAALLPLLAATPPVAQAAAASLKKLGALAEPQLLEALRVSGSAERRILIPVLAGRRAAKNALISCLADEDATVRALACDGLARISDSTAAPAIFPLLGDDDTRVAQAALGAIQSLGSDETRRLTLALAGASSGEPRARRAALRIIGYFGYAEGLDALALAVHGEDEPTREAALASLPFLDHPNARALLLDAATHPSVRTRIAALRALGHGNGEPEAVERLRLALTDSDAWVRYYACQALGRLHVDDATEAIAGLLDDRSGQVRVAAVDALAHLRGPRAFEVLSRVVGSADAELHRAGLVALGISKRPEALPNLLLALESPIATTRLVALSALAELGFDETAPAIAARVLDEDEGVRVAALGFLAARTDATATRELLVLLSKDPGRQELIAALARPAPGRVEALARALTEADDEYASALVASLSRNAGEDARAALRAAFQSSHDAARRASAAALIAMQDPTSAPHLGAAALNDPDAEVRRICAAYLALS
ncbi:MAG: HEAT repeat domain-containing protein [Pseudomonadota bacterium]